MRTSPCSVLWLSALPRFSAETSDEPVAVAVDAAPAVQAFASGASLVDPPPVAPARARCGAGALPLPLPRSFENRAEPMLHCSPCR